MDFYPNKRKGLAIVVGISDYDDNKKLRNAKNDAVAISEQFESLQYIVLPLYDVSKDEFDSQFFDTIDGKTQYDVVVFFFAGHGMHCNLSDCIVFKDAPRINKNDGYPALQKSWKIEELLQFVRSQQDCAMIISIIDACRVDVIAEEDTDSDAMRSVIEPNKDFLSKIKLPYQTLIAYATSPHKAASDGAGDHSPYTQALLTQIMKIQPVETTFKNIRKAIYTDPSAQLPWEHSCLVDEFSFNYGQLAPHYGSIYNREVFAPSNFSSENSHFKALHDSLDGKTADAINIVRSLVANVSKMTVSEQFCSGRLICNLMDKAPETMDTIMTPRFLNQSLYDGVSHVLNGILYELYFDINDSYKTNFSQPDILDYIFRLSNDQNFVDSFKFIQEELNTREEHKGYVPGVNSGTKKIRLELEETDLGDQYGNRILSLKRIEGLDGYIEFFDNIQCSVFTYKGIRNIIWKQARFPHMLLKLGSNLRVDNQDIVILGELSVDSITQDLENYFAEGKNSSLDMMCHHYEISDLFDVECLSVYEKDGFFEIEGSFVISTIQYLDSEEDVRSDVQIDGRYKIYYAHHWENEKFKLEIQGTDVNLETSDFFK